MWHYPPPVVAHEGEPLRLTVAALAFCLFMLIRTTRCSLT